jgi:hypothetical protein
MWWRRLAPVQVGRALQAAAITLLALWAFFVGDPAKPAAPDSKQLDEDAVAYINAHSDKEDMVMIPMRDGVRQLPVAAIRAPDRY